MGENIRRPLVDYSYDEEEEASEVLIGLANGETAGSGETGEDARDPNRYGVAPSPVPLYPSHNEQGEMEPIRLRTGPRPDANGSHGNGSKNGRESLHDRIRQETSGFNFHALTHQAVDEKTPETPSRPTPPPAYAPFGMLEEGSDLGQQELPSIASGTHSLVEPVEQIPPPDVLEAPPAATDYALVNEKNGRRYRLMTGPNTIGREHCDIRLKDSTVSRRHAQVTITQGQIYLVDTGSRNGTLLNGSRMASNEPVSIMDGAVIRMGNTKLSLAWMPEPPSPTVEPLPFVLPEFPPVTPAVTPEVVSREPVPDTFQRLEPQALNGEVGPLETVVPETSGESGKRPKKGGRTSYLSLVLSLLFLVFALAVAAYVLNGTIKDW